MACEPLAVFFIYSAIETYSRKCGKASTRLPKGSSYIAAGLKALAVSVLESKGNELSTGQKRRLYI